jgi:hypothetical protein
MLDVTIWVVETGNPVKPDNPIKTAETSSAEAP